MHAIKSISATAVVILLELLLLQAAEAGAAAGQPVLAREQTVYVPVYSNVFSAPKQIPLQLTTILSIRNTDMSNSISVTAADYYDTKGKLLKRYYQKPLILSPLESTYIYLPENDVAGGFGANFIVTWNARKEVNAPIIECVMIGARSGQGISFVSPGQVIKSTP